MVTCLLLMTGALTPISFAVITNMCYRYICVKYQQDLTAIGNTA